jgi:CRISPR-associated protein Csx14
MEEVCKQIRTYRYRNFDIYISLAGGRKTMSALMCLSAQIYGAKMLLHVIVPPWIEQDGMIDILERKSKDEQKEILHPSQEDVSLVRLPFISLFPMLEEIQEALNSETIQNKEVKEMLLTNGLIEVMEDKCVSTEMGKKLLEILNNIESLPEPSSTSPEKKQVNIKDHDYERKKEDVERFARRLCYCPYVEKVESIKFQPGTKTGIIRVLENGDIDVGYDIRKCRVLLRVYTTAKNKAEGNRVRKELSGFIKYG